VISPKRYFNIIRSQKSTSISKKNMAHQRQDETKQPSPPPSTETTTTLTTSSDMYLSTHLIVPYFINAQGEIKRPEHLIAWWSRIFSFLFLYDVPDEKDHIPLRSLCRLFRDSLKPLPFWTSFPHPNFSTLNGLMNKLNEMYAALPDIVWEVPTSLLLETLVVGMKVRVKYGDVSFKDATIQKVNENETFDIVFDDGNFGTRKNVPLNEIQIQNVSGV
jgi:hypothetical protein